MACPTCDHTMHKIYAYFWCPRCGTIKTELGEDSETNSDMWSITAPKLVARCLKFEEQLGETESKRWITLGIAESIGK